ncbi:hypothetical protein PQE75_gp145 [Bacillus phage vB_BcoS-136]|uniref:Transmembrane Fragile-X-F protein n=1 Tax=Bacillus phage vB_BcoS-136 TaxID=2419619 RepID=A0A3G3BVS7_9CAUD|nr:hypothetical protein PQE75_gp145 [Bacillus phage vB_BcoS-136]AYP68334.1 hypothetical protein vBBcoS136_00220 [Bacillus phage vB_BcoS-136]
MNKSTSGGGIGFLGLLTILFIGLKLTGFVEWSWWWVLSPMLIPFSIALIILVVMIIFAMTRYKT